MQLKSFTDLEQSKKLAEILPLESADMHYCLENRDVATGYKIGIVPFIQARKFKGKCNIVDIQPAWSLAALLNIIPKCIKDYNVLRIDIGENNTDIWYDEIGYGVNNNLPDIIMEYAVDACVAMIEKLHELNLL